MMIMMPLKPEVASTKWLGWERPMVTYGLSLDLTCEYAYTYRLSRTIGVFVSFLQENTFTCQTYDSIFANIKMYVYH